MIEQKEVTVKGDKYLITQFGGIRGVKYGKRVAKIILPILSVVFSQEGEDINIGRIMDVVVDNIDQLDEQLIQELMQNVSKNGTSIDFDKEFAGNYDTLFILLQEVIEFNFQSLFQLGLDGSEAK